MKVGQTSVVVFLSNLAASVLGFLATLYFARVLGAEIMGYYAVALAVVAWLKLGGTLGISDAAVKRISEGEDQQSYFTAGVIIVTIFGTVLSLIAFLFQNQVDAYVGVEVWYYVIVLLLSGLVFSFVQSILKAERKVHIAGVLTPVNVTFSSLIQIGLVFASFGLSGMLLGFLIGEIVTAVLGIVFLSLGFAYPKQKHFKNLFDFAKFSWLGGLKMRSFNDVDILVLGMLSTPTLVGVYSVAWGISKFLTIFGNAVRSTLFPEISHADAKERGEKVANLTTDSLAFIGLIAIPGLFGGGILADRLLLIYGEEFTQGTRVLYLLILATLIFNYQQQMMGIIKAIDRPELAFRINAVFIVTNVVLNVVLVFWIGWVGAAVATVISATIGLILAFKTLYGLIQFEIPYQEIGQQFAAALIMAGFVSLLRQSIESSNLPHHNVLIVLSLVLIGTIIYFLTLMAISPRFRKKISENMPAGVPMFERI